jgi:Ca-activated chloride channel family protein
MRTKPILLTLFGTVIAAAGIAISHQTSRACSPGPTTDPSALKLTVATDRPLLHRGAGPQDVVVRVEISGAPREREDTRQPLNLAVVLDRSGSMRGAKIEQARQAAEMLVERLQPDDIFSLVIYDSEVETLVPPQPVGHRADSIRAQIRALQPGGSTALYHGVEAGGRHLAEFFSEQKINRVLLLSDGIANVGPSSNREIASLGTSLANRGISVTTIGLGDDYNEDLMTALAEASDANYYHVADVEALPDVFKRELGELEKIVARRLTVEITFPEGVEPLEFLGRDDKLGGRKGTIAFSTLAAEQKREIYIACRVDPGKFTGGAAAVAQATVTYREATGESELRADGEALVKTVEDATLAAKAQDAEIVSQAELYRNATVTRRAIDLADQGKGAEAKKVINDQISRLRQQQSAAPSSAAAAYESDIRILEENSGGIAGGGIAPQSRKALQYRVYEVGNSKTLSTEPVTPRKK